jgi:hypothetical protein
MGRFGILIVSAVVGVLIAVVGTAATLAALNPSAAKVATDMANEANANGQGGKAAADPLDPPNFYGAR